MSTQTAVPPTETTVDVRAFRRRRKPETYWKPIVAWSLALIYLFPVYWMIVTSFKTGRDMFSNPPQFIPENWYFGSYEAAFSPEYGIGRAFINSIIIAGTVLVLTLLIAVPASYAVARLRGRTTTSMMVSLTVVQLLPAITISVPLFVMFRQMDLVNSYISIILADISVTLPFAVILLRPYFKLFPYEVEEAAKLDGLTAIGTIVRIVIPTIRPGLIMISSFAFLMAWGEFTFALTLLTDQSMQPLTVALNRLIGQYGTNWNDLMAVATLIALPVLIVFVFLQRYIVAGLAGGATKG